MWFLFSGDGDFERAIELLRSKNTHITVVSTEGMIARELRNVSDQYIDLQQLYAVKLKNQTLKSVISLADCDENPKYALGWYSAFDHSIVEVVLAIN